MIGRWWPALPGRPVIWFVVEEHLDQARTLPELEGYDWYYYREPGEVSLEPPGENSATNEHR